MIKILFAFFFLVFMQFTALAQQVKNVIMMIPDGTSADLITLSRWYNEQKPLAIDSIICGFVKTHSNDNKFPDSAPTATAYATGIKTNKKNIGADSDANPLFSILELAKLNGLSTGIVVTCQFPHATPADFVCHFNDRENYKTLAKQFIYNSPSIVFAGGRSFINNYGYDVFLSEKNIRLITDIKSFKELKPPSDAGEIFWALFSDWRGKTKWKSFECDRDTLTEPSLSEMTQKAIDVLSQNKNGFFLLVEGSQIDWACHNNDPFAAVTDFLEFDRAVNAALKFAKSDSNTLVVVCPDHGNGGLSIGNYNSPTDFIFKSPNKYENINIEKRIIAPLKEIKFSGRKFAEMVETNLSHANTDTIKKYYNLDLPQITIDQISFISKKYAHKGMDTIQYILGSRYSAKNYIGWTTTGHTAEDVFLAIYAPIGIERITGVIDNSDIGKYIARQMNLGSLKDETDKYYSFHKKLFMEEEIIHANLDSLVVRKNETVLIVFANTNKYEVRKGNSIKLGILSTIAVCIKNGNDEAEVNYFIPKSLLDILNNR